MFRSTRSIMFMIMILLILILISACSFLELGKTVSEPEPPEITATDTPPPPPTPTVEPTEAPPTLTPTEVVPTEEPTLTPIVHLMVANPIPPGEPQVIHDHESDRKADQKEAYAGDEFLRGRYERPFDQDMNYIPVIDIKQANLFRDADDDFIYAVIHLKEDPALLPDIQIGLGVELDLDIDGRGNILVWTMRPLTTDWSVAGVSVWKDLNINIGGLTPVKSDDPPGDDGYEVNIFDAGVGSDPDMAWSRISPKDPMLIELAFKKDLLGDTEIFLWGAWTIQGADQFELFDHNDHFTFEEAGSPMKSEADYYPLKEMYALDNTCRAASGFTPNGGEPGLCPIYDPPATAEEDPPGCIPICIRPCLASVGCCEWGCR
ncbi:MAG: hypothetical protein JEZ06_06305 [Anaerolineaceae bacterium]|nr:hypothetical protein [Anaerolineaceae bacterium]